MLFRSLFRMRTNICLSIWFTVSFLPVRGNLLYSNALDLQRLLLDYAKKNGIIISKDFIFEESVSGRNADKRPKFQEMIGIAKQESHPLDVILVWKYSRFARNQEESIVYKSLLKKSNVDVISISEPLIDGPFGTLIERIIDRKSTRLNSSHAT